MLTEEIAREMVAAGGKLLDGKAGDGWWGKDRINLGRLNIDDIDNCVLGQLCHEQGMKGMWLSGYDYALDAWLGRSTRRACELGFLAGPQLDQSAAEQMGLLTQAWRDYIIARRVAPQKNLTLKKVLARVGF